MIGLAMLAIRFAPRTLSPVWEASKEKNISLKKVFCNKGTLTNQFEYAFIQKNSCVLRRSYIFFSLLRKEGDSNPRYPNRVRQFSKLVVSATHPSFLTEQLLKYFSKRVVQM